MRVQESIEFRGQIKFLDAKLNDKCIEDKHIDTVLSATKLEHQHRGVYAQESATTAADEARVVHVVHGGDALVKAFKAGCVVACIGDATISVDLLKNGASILTAAISIDSGDAAYALVAAEIDTAALVEGDVVEVAVDGTVGTGTLGKGVFAYFDCFEDMN